MRRCRARRTFATIWRATGAASRSARRLDVRARNRQRQLAAEAPLELLEHAPLLFRMHDLLPRVEEAELDEVVIEERGAVREAHRHRVLDDLRDREVAQHVA